MKPLLDKFRQDGYRLYRDKSFRLSFFDYFLCYYSEREN